MRLCNKSNVDDDNSVKDRRTMKVSLLAVFAAPLQITDKMKIVPMGTSRSRTSVTWGIWRLASAAENDGEKEGKFPPGRHEHLLGLIGRSHSPAQVQAKEREERRWLS